MTKPKDHMASLSILSKMKGGRLTSKVELINDPEYKPASLARAIKSLVDQGRVLEGPTGYYRISGEGLEFRKHLIRTIQRRQAQSMMQGDPIRSRKSHSNRPSKNPITLPKLGFMENRSHDQD